MNNDPIVFASFYSLTIGVFPARFRCHFQRLFTGIPANRNLYVGCRHVLEIMVSGVGSESLALFINCVMGLS